MKHSLLFGLLFLLAASSSAQRINTNRELTGAEASELVEGAEHIWLKEANTIPAFIQFRIGQEPSEPFFFSYIRKKFQLPANYGFQLQSSEPDGLGWQHKRYQLTINGIPVTNGQFVTHLQAGRVVKFNGYLFTGLQFNTTPAINETDALQKALENIGAIRYKWQEASEEAFIKMESGDANATFYPKGELAIVQVGDNSSTDFRLTWKFDVYAQEPMSRYYIYVDAESGTVVKKESRICNANTNGTAVTVYRGSRAIVADSYNGAYRLKETTRGLGVHTYNLQKSTNYGGAVEFTDADNVWNNVNANLDQYAGDAHWGAEMTYDFYQSMGRNSIDNAGYALNLYVHYSTNYLNAFWDGTRMTFGDGSSGYTPLTSLDITGHEISHGLDEKTANLTYQDESGALNESFSDIFGTAVEWYADSTVGNWLIGEDIGSAFRSMSNPNSTGDPDTYHGTNWYTGTADNGGVHTNSNVQNHWYYRLSQGGSGTNDIGNAYNVTAIGRNKATKIAWRDMVYYLTSSADYADSRFYSIQAANDLYGACSQEAISTTNAWYAVGVGGPFVFGVDAQFTASPTSGCSVPFTVNFVNSSTNAGSYSWTFGDGGTSTATNPTHTYSSLGVYTVKLIADGGSCGVDSLVSTNLINLNAANPCVVIMKDTGTYTTQTACSGTVYDNGGPSANYTDNTNSVVTIAPTGATSVTLHFTQFAMENTYDFLYVYDGPSTASTLLGSYTGTTIPANITSSGGSITLRQSSDESVTAAGFAVTWSCIAPTLPPVANFTADVTQTCTGSIKFTDLSTNTPTSWNWNFGDGQTSTLKNPTHVYANNGTYTVVLTATNAYGNNTLTKTAYITVNKPSGPTIANQSSCGPSAFTLSITTTDTLSWADSTGTVVSNANPFTTPVLTQTRTYWVSSSVTAPSYHVGPTYPSGATNYTQATERGEVFNVLKPGILQSVYVNASGAGNRTIRLLNAGGTVLYSTTINIPAGTSRVTLNFPLTVGTGYQLTATGPANLFRNSTGATYPYTDAGGIVSITNNTANAAGYYYFFYDWIVKENNCISLKTPVTLTVNPAVTVSTSSINPACNGSSNGSVTVSVLTGSPSYTYNWSNGQTNVTANNLAAGIYTVTVTDNKSCTATASKTLTQPAAIVAGIVKTNVLCNGAGNGTATASVTSGGLAPFSYNWNTGATTNAISNLAPGTYTVSITDAGSCSVSATTSITQPTTFNVAGNTTNLSCNGSTNGSINLQLTGGTSPYNVTWSNSSTATNLTNLSAGTYMVTARDANNCSVTASFILSQPAAITITPSAGNTTCGLNNGTVTTIVSGGTGGYTYVWNNGSTSSGLSSLAAGTYNLTVTDGATCTATGSATIAGSVGITATATGTNITCNGTANGTALATVSSGGTLPYSYNWSNAATSPGISNLSAGLYSVTVSDALLCSTTASVNVTQPATLQVSATATNPTCNAGTNGSLNLQISGGTSAYIVTWSNSSSGTTIGNLTAGTYTATVTDANNCTTTVTQMLTQPSAISITPTVNNTSCGLANGNISTAVNGGNGIYSYAWGTGATTSSLSNLTAGAYSLTVTDAAICTATANINVTSSVGLIASLTKTDITCNGASNGTAMASISSGGTPPYSYVWNNGATAPGISNLTAGNYIVTITDAVLCSATGTASITQPTALNIIATTVNPSCYAGTNGSVSLQVSGGTTAYSFNWSNGSTGISNTSLAAGTYTATITDANNCTAAITRTLTQPSAITIVPTVTNTTCGFANGSITTNITGGTGTYSYNWNNGATAPALSNLAAGTYSLTVTDAANCSAVSSSGITTSSSLIASASGVNVSCFGLNNGSATVAVSNNTNPTSYNWSNGNTVATAGNLSAGTYTVSVTDANNCSATAVYTVTQPAAISASVTATGTNCTGNTGTVSLQVSGGTGSYGYAWSNGANTASLNNVGAGNYLVTITDGNNCTATAGGTVNSPGGISASATTSMVTCNGGATGTIAITVTAGTAPYNYNWSNGASTSTISNLIAGIYVVTITDANNCSFVSSNNISQPAALLISVSATNGTCGQSNGSLQSLVTGGTAGYNYSWSNGASTSGITNLMAGNYTITVSDAHSCSSSQQASITTGPALGFQVSATNAPCFGGTGTATANVTTGTAPYTYTWSNGATQSSPGNLVAGLYYVTVSDIAGCSATSSVSVSAPAALTVSITTVDAGCAGNNGSATATTTGGTGGYNYVWNTGSGNAALSGISGGSYTVTVTDANNCSTSAIANVASSGGITLSTSTHDILCYAQNTGEATVNVNGGLAPFTYNWSNGGNTTAITNLPAGTYTVSATDANNCFASATLVITQPTALSTTLSGIEPLCHGTSNGQLSIAVNGGIGTYTYSWSNGATNATNTNLTAGLYSVTVTDANNCSVTAGNTLNEPAVLTIGQTTTQPLCNGDNSGSIQLSIQGGTPAYTFSWNTGATTAGLSNLTGGNYSVTVNDANGCLASQAISLSNPPALTPMATVADVACSGGSNGSISLTVTGGTPTYTYSWSTGATAAQLSQLTIGTYSVTVYDANNCSASFSTTISQPSPIAFTTGSLDASNGQSNGTAWATAVSGGTPPYNFAWTGFDLYNNDTLYNLAAGTYWVVVTDDNGCSKTDSVVVNAISAINQVALMNLKLFPNPATDAVQLTGELIENGTLSIKNELGQELHTQPVNSGTLNVHLPIGLLASGIYYLEIKTSGKSIVKQLVISR